MLNGSQLVASIHGPSSSEAPDCVDDALKQCPALRAGAALYTVATALPAGVLADLYRPARDLMPVLYGHNVLFPGIPARPHITVAAWRLARWSASMATRP